MKTCELCKKEFTVSPKDIRKKFCCLDCFYNHKKEDTLIKIEEKKVTEEYQKIKETTIDYYLEKYF
jgi:hypothetical protein